MNRHEYPPEWDAIAVTIKGQARWRCEYCDLQCRRPGDPFDTHKRTLTVAHINHIPDDCRPANLIALCAPCHMRYDNTRRQMERIAARRVARHATNVLNG